jgi:microcystin-dependent protein
MPKFLDERQRWDSYEALIANDSIIMPDGFNVYCELEQAWYQLSTTNSSDISTYIWTEVGASESGSPIKTLSAAAWEALAEKDPNTYYIVSDLGKMYHGTTEVFQNNAAFSNAVIGTIVPYAGTTAPYGYLMCDGSEVSRTKYYQLFNVIGTTYGEGDGSTTFKVPDLRESVPVGVGRNTTNTIANHDEYTLGQFKDDQVQGHAHSYTFDNTTTVLASASGVEKATPTVLPKTSTTQDIISFEENGTPRVGDSTHGKQLGVNYIIKAFHANEGTDIDNDSIVVLESKVDGIYIEESGIFAVEQDILESVPVGYKAIGIIGIDVSDSDVYINSYSIIDFKSKWRVILTNSTSTPKTISVTVNLMLQKDTIPSTAAAESGKVTLRLRTFAPESKALGDIWLTTV